MFLERKKIEKELGKRVLRAVCRGMARWYQLSHTMPYSTAIQCIQVAEGDELVAGKDNERARGRLFCECG